MMKCPTCEDTFKNELGMKSHHAQKHGESIAGYEYTCEWCGKDGRKRQIDDRDDHQFCSQSCYHEWRADTLVGENSPVWEGRQITVECDYCNSGVEKHAVNVEKTENNFCDQDCHSRWKAENQTGEDNPVYNPESHKSVECANCSDKITKPVWKVERNERCFCNKDCYSEWQSENQRGENHPRWVVGTQTVSYGGTWPKQRRKRLRKDDHECVVCSQSNEQEKIDTGRGLSVHHITPAKEFIQEDGSLNESRAHRVENLITLCSKCHRRWEGIPLRPVIE